MTRRSTAGVAEHVDVGVGGLDVVSGCVDDVRARSQRDAAREAAESRARQQASDPAARSATLARLADADRHRLEEMQGRVLGRLRALNMDIPMNVQSLSYERLEQMYDEILRSRVPRAARGGVARQWP